MLTRLAKTTDLIKTWPESDGDDASIHVQTTTKLINCVLDVVTALQKVEGAIKTDAVLKKSLQECKVPINLLDLLDHGNGLNPGKSYNSIGWKNVVLYYSFQFLNENFFVLARRLDCFSRGLLREALGQLAGLKRRKLALEMLGAAIQNGLDQQNSMKKKDDAVDSSAGGSQKRKLEIESTTSNAPGEQQNKEQEEKDETEEPVTKKMRTEAVQ